LSSELETTKDDKPDKKSLGYVKVRKKEQDNGLNIIIPLPGPADRFARLIRK